MNILVNKMMPLSSKDQLRLEEITVQMRRIANER